MRKEFGGADQELIQIHFIPLLDTQAKSRGDGSLWNSGGPGEQQGWSYNGGRH